MPAKGFYPPKNFEENMERLIALFKEHGWEFKSPDKEGKKITTLDASVLEQALSEYKPIREADQKAEQDYRIAHEKYIDSGRATYSLFYQALVLAETMNKKNPPILKSLKSLRRTFAKKQPPTGTK